MSNNTDKQDFLAGFLKRLEKDERDGLHKVVTEEADDDEPVAYEHAYMAENGEISIRANQYLPDGSVGDGGYTLKPDDEAYEVALKRFGPLKPGHGRTIVQRLINGQWVDQKSS